MVWTFLSIAIALSLLIYYSAPARAEGAQTVEEGAQAVEPTSEKVSETQVEPPKQAPADHLYGLGSITLGLAGTRFEQSTPGRTSGFSERPFSGLGFSGSIGLGFESFFLEYFGFAGTTEKTGLLLPFGVQAGILLPRGLEVYAGIEGGWMSVSSSPDNTFSGGGTKVGAAFAPLRSIGKVDLGVRGELHWLSFNNDSYGRIPEPYKTKSWMAMIGLTLRFNGERD